jgi:protease IV
MSLETDLLLDRRRLKRRLVFWRVFAVVALVVAALGVFRGAGLAPRGAHITRVSVDGLITEDRKVTEAIDKLADDSQVKAVILSIDSPGGSVSGGETIHDAIARVAAKKPVVVTMGGLAASAGYMIAMPANRIFAREATLTGSIGVLIETGEISGLLGKLGIGPEVIRSGPLKDEPSLVRPLSKWSRRAGIWTRQKSAPSPTAAPTPAARRSSLAWSTPSAVSGKPRHG